MATKVKILLEKDNLVLFELVIKLMVYKNYQGIANAIYYNKAGLYIKRFAKPYRDATNLKYYSNFFNITIVIVKLFLICCKIRNR